MLEYRLSEHHIFGANDMPTPTESKPISAQAFKEEALSAWKHYQETGLHVTLEEVCDWLNTWGTPSEKEAPICHKSF